jgi:hypothetical protein
MAILVSVNSSSLRWGLVPYWARDEKIGLRTINAKAETIATTPGVQRGNQVPTLPMPVIIPEIARRPVMHPLRPLRVEPAQHVSPLSSFPLLNEKLSISKHTGG